MEEELSYRTQTRTIRFRKQSHLPRRVFDNTSLPNGIKWQLEQLMNLTWVEDEQNLIILSKCGTAKTSLAVMLCDEALENNIKVFYTTREEFIIVLRQRERMPKADNLFRYMRESSVIVIDERFYSDIMREEAQLLHRGIALQK